MKNALIILTTIMMSFTTLKEEPVDRIGVKGPLTFNKTAYNLSWTSKPTASYYIQEYLPQHENPDHFNQMMSIFLLVGDTKLSSAVQQKTAELDERKKTDATCNYMVTANPAKTEYMVDFVLGENKNTATDVEEFNIYYYKLVDAGNNKKAILVYAYSKRAYGDAVNPFLKNLKPERTALLNAMVAAEKPVVKINE